MFWVIPLILITVLSLFLYVNEKNPKANPESWLIALVLFILFVVTSVIAIFLPFNDYDLSYTDTGRKIIITTIATACAYGAMTVAIWTSAKKFFKWRLTAVLTLFWIICFINPLAFTDLLVNG